MPGQVPLYSDIARCVVVPRREPDDFPGLRGSLVSQDQARAGALCYRSSGPCPFSGRCSGRGGPELDDGARATGGDQGAIGAEGHGEKRAPLHLLRWKLLTQPGIPDSDGLVGARGNEPSAVGAVSQSSGIHCVSSEDTSGLAFGNVPDLDELIKAAGADRLSVRVKATAMMPSRWALIVLIPRPVALVPELEVAVVACAHQRLSVRTDRQTGYFSNVRPGRVWKMRPVVVFHSMTM